MKRSKSIHHLSYILRLWSNEGFRDSEWRASLEIPETGKRIGFAHLEQLFAYLMDLITGIGKLQPTEKERTDKAGIRD